MLTNFFAKPLELKLGGKTLSFVSVEDFEFAISSKVSVPSTKVMDMVKCTAQQLEKEARAIKKVEKSFVAMLCRFIEEPDNISRLLKEIDTSIFSQDHAWRDIIITLNGVGDEFNALRKVALIKYMQYLSSRQDIIKHLYSQKKRAAGNKQDEAMDQQDMLKETLVTFEDKLFEQHLDVLDASEFGRVPKGESIILTLDAEEQIAVILSKHKCFIKASRRIFFITPSGRKHVLNIGRNEIGRSISGTVPIDSSLKDISRLHLVIETLSDTSFKLTDLSSHGTYLKVKFLKRYNC